MHRSLPALLATLCGLCLAPLSAQKLHVYVLVGQSNMQGHARVETFDYIGDDPATAPLLARMRTPDGAPRVCDDVWISYLTGRGDEVGEGFGRLTAGCAAPPAIGEGLRWVDLTHAFCEDAVYWPTADGFEFVVDSKGRTPGGWWYESNSFRTSEHGGTHLDAPRHFAEGAYSSDEVPIDQLVGPACVVDVRAACALDRDYQVTVGDLEAFEARHGRIEPGNHLGHWPLASDLAGVDRDQAISDLDDLVELVGVLDEVGEIGGSLCVLALERDAAELEAGIDDVFEVVAARVLEEEEQLRELLISLR